MGPCVSRNKTPASTVSLLPKQPVILEGDNNGSSEDYLGRLSKKTDYDVFISHAGKDKYEIASRLARGLEANGVKVCVDYRWLQPGDTGVMEQALMNSRMALFVLSPTFFDRKCSQKEAQIFLSRNSSQVVVYPLFYAINKDENDLDQDQQELLRKLSSAAPSTIEQPRKLNETNAVYCERICADVIRQLRDKFSFIPQSKLIKLPSPVPWFVDNNTQQIVDSLLSDISLSTTPRVLQHVIKGKPGIGKSQLSYTLCELLSPEFNLIWHIDGSSIISTQAGLVALATAVRLPGQQDKKPMQIVKAVFEYLEQLTRPWLLLLDNISINGDIVASTLGIQLTTFKPKANGVILATSAHDEWDAGKSTWQIYQMNALTPSVSLQVMHQRLRKYLHTMKEDEKNELKSFCDETSGSAITTSFSAAYLADSKSPPSKFHEIYQRAYKRYAKYDDLCPCSILAIFEVIYTRQSALGKTLIHLLSMLAPYSISRQLLIELAESSDGLDDLDDDFDSVLSFGFYLAGVNEQDQPQTKEPVKLTKDQTPLSSSVTTIPGSSSTVNVLCSHALIKQATRLICPLAPDRSVLWLKAFEQHVRQKVASMPAITAAVTPTLPSPPPSASLWPSGISLSLWSSTLLGSPSSTLASTSRQSLSSTSRQSMSRPESTVLSSQSPAPSRPVSMLLSNLVMPRRQSASSTRPPSSLMSPSELMIPEATPQEVAAMKERKGRVELIAHIESAIEFATRLISELTKRIKGKSPESKEEDGEEHDGNGNEQAAEDEAEDDDTQKHIDTLIKCVPNLHFWLASILHHDAEQPDMAVKHYTEALQAFEKICDPKDDIITQVLFGLGLAYGDAGNAAKKKEKLEQALIMSEQNQDKLIVPILQSLAMVVGFFGDTKRKRDLLMRSLEIEEKEYGSDDLRVARTRNAVANATRDLGDAATAKNMLMQVLAVREEKHGRDHVEVAVTLDNLASALGDLGDMAGKRNLLERALPMMERVYGPTHIVIAIPLHNYATVVGDLGDTLRKKDLLQKVLAIEERHYGADHVEVARTLNSLANAFEELKEPKQAQRLLERALAIQEKHYGPDHIEVGITLHNLANAIGVLNDRPRQKALLEGALAIKERHYGNEHVEVARTLHSLGNATGAMGNREEQLQLLNKAIAIYEQHYSTEGIPMALALTGRGFALTHLRRLQDAKLDFERAIEIYQANRLPENHTHVVYVQNLLKKLNNKLRKREQQQQQPQQN